ncbi:helix-turn-helix domain-containing protein [Paludibacter jiangxiensis]|uniref:Helix-turn-helix domain-containing protein n=1 Tax=Paludibacter jiangxiensis TaxID=681398 RepID=A0A171A8T6_9BACT|nr:helix-turn-helix domain-containing protein [Paludibacter jiangxiensis]GAT63401.1 helix-turn-helix domain-containing protein [Paludibacter jiangxiensis]
MLIEDIMKNGTNVSIALSAKDLQEVINQTVKATREEIEQLIVDDKSEVYLSPKQVSEMLDVDLSTLWRWDKRNYLKAYSIGGKKRYRKSDIKNKLNC